MLKTTFACTHYALVALLAYAAYSVGVRRMAGVPSAPRNGVPCLHQLRGTLPTLPPTHSVTPSTLLQAHASQMHAAGQLLPALQAALERPVPLPAAVSTAQAAAAAGAVALAGALLAWLLVWRRPSPTYLLDFECYRPGAWRRSGLYVEHEGCAVRCGQRRAAVRRGSSI